MFTQNIIILYTCEIESNFLLDVLSTCDNIFIPSTDNIIDNINLSKFNFTKDIFANITEYYKMLNLIQKKKILITKLKLEDFDKIIDEEKENFLNKFKINKNYLLMLNTNSIDSFIRTKINNLDFNQIIKINIMNENFISYYNNYKILINKYKNIKKIELYKFLISYKSSTIIETFKNVINNISNITNIILSYDDNLFTNKQINYSKENIKNIFFNNHCYKINNYKLFETFLKDNGIDYLLRCDKYDYLK